jgi:hypothetical protein
VCPFGTIKSLRMVHLPASSSTAPAPRITAAIAHYTSLAAAQDAHRALEGESYAGCMVRVAYLVEPEPEPTSAPESPLPETPTFPAQLNFPPSRSSSSFATAPHCRPLVHKPVFDGRNVGNQVFGGVGYGYVSAGRQWRGPELVQQQQFYPAPPFPRFESRPAYGVNELPGRSVLFRHSSPCCLSPMLGGSPTRCMCVPRRPATWDTTSRPLLLQLLVLLASCLFACPTVCTGLDRRC